MAAFVAVELIFELFAIGRTIKWKEPAKRENPPPGFEARETGFLY